MSNTEEFSPYAPPRASLDLPDDVGGESPQAGDPQNALSAADWVNLFFRPREFYRKRVFPRWQMLLFGGIAGMGAAIDRIDTRIAQADFGGHTAAGTLAVADSWSWFWGAVLLAGAVSGWIYWYLLGWWYRARLYWSGAGRVSKELPRALSASAGFVWAGPGLIFLCIATLAYPNYRAASESPFAFLSLLLLFVSVWTSYSAATTRYRLYPGRALWWFAGFPLLFYLSIVVIFAYLGYRAASSS